MYVATFYSFKGGVGRSMALVNVGAELAQTGRRVLLVDFDLEAPGLDTFHLPTPAPKPGQIETRGVVDFVRTYIETGTAPEFTDDYYYESPLGLEHDGKLWIMPAGRQNNQYGDRLNSIDWDDLYRHQDGYLLFEDLKQQWKDRLRPDYVLIDSRTGHTDVAGICTRHLPDAVVVLFFPNEQNLLGLKHVVTQIQAEADTPRKKEIKLHFVTSNVPDLDDENQILASRMQRFQKALGYRRLSAEIHHYPSLALLNQTVFTLERRTSRLAAEYRELVRRLVRENYEDQEAAQAFFDNLARLPSRVGPHGPTGSLERRIEQIRESHSSNGSIIARVAQFRQKQGRLEEAWALMNQAASAGAVGANFLKERVILAYRLEDPVAAEEAAARFLKEKEAAHVDVVEVVSALVQNRSGLLMDLPGSRVLASLDPSDRVEIAWELLREKDNLPVADQILKDVLALPELPERVLDRANCNRVLGLIAFQRFAEALSLIGDLTTNIELTDAFNAAMATWGATRTLPVTLFERVLETAGNDEFGGTANHQQCAAITFWAVGDIEEAQRRSSQARELMMSYRRYEFSCWRYLQASPRDFLRDLNEIDRMIAGEEILPGFMSAGTSEGS